MITKEIALRLKFRDIVIHTVITNKDGSPFTARVNGKCKTWKTRPNEFYIPIKRGLRDCGYITQDNADEWTIK